MNNQLGLEALAALASAAPPPAPGQRSSGETTQTSEGGGSQSSGSAAGGTTTTGSTGGSDGKPSSARDNSNPSQKIDPASQSSASQMSSQIQQLVSSLAASGGGSNPNAVNNQGFPFLSGLPSTGQTDNSSLMMAMQNAAHYNLLAQAQAANQQNQLSALSNLAMQLSRGSHPQGPPGLGLGLQNPLASFFDGT